MSTTQATAAIAMLRSASTRIVSPAGQTSGEQLARPGALALAERLGIAVTICGQPRRVGSAHRNSPTGRTRRFEARDVENVRPAPTTP
jgi:hypothetical protein